MKSISREVDLLSPPVSHGPTAHALPASVLGDIRLRIHGLRNETSLFLRARFERRAAALQEDKMLLTLEAVEQTEADGVAAETETKSAAKCSYSELLELRVWSFQLNAGCVGCESPVALDMVLVKIVLPGGGSGIGLRAHRHRAPPCRADYRALACSPIIQSSRSAFMLRRRGGRRSARLGVCVEILSCASTIFAASGKRVSDAQST